MSDSLISKGYVEKVVNKLEKDEVDNFSTATLLEAVYFLSTLLEVGYQDTSRVNRLSKKYVSGILNRYFSIHPLHFSIFDGKMGIVMLVSYYDKCAHTNFLSKIIDDFNSYLPEFINSSYSNNGFKKGKSGVLYGILRCINEYDTKIKIADQTNDLLNRLFDTLKFQRKGISFRDKEAFHIKPTGGLGEGNAGYLLTYATVYHYSGLKAFKRLTYQLHAYQQSLWVNKINNWADYQKNIEDIETHYLHLKKFREGKLNFFKAPKDDISFWHGTLGITNTYFSLYEIFKDKQFLKEAERGLSKLLKSQRRKTEEVDLLTVFAKADSITNNNIYRQKKNTLFKKVLEKDNLSYPLASYILLKNFRNIGLKNNFFFFQTSNLSKETNRSVVSFNPAIQPEVILLRNTFPKSLAIWSLVYKQDINDFILPDQKKLSLKSLKKVFIKHYKQEAKKQSNFSLRYLLKEIIFNESKYVSLKDKNTNMAMLRAKELATIHLAHDILSMSEEQFLSQRIKASSNLDFIETKFDWNTVSADTIYNLSTIEERYFLLLSTSSGIHEMPTTPNELLILHFFSSPTVVHIGVASYLKELELEELDEEYNAVYANIIKIIRKLICNHCLVSCL